MKERIIEVIRSVPIAGKTYEEYVEAIADKLQNEKFEMRNEKLRVAMEIFAEIEAIPMENMPYAVCLNIHNKIAELKKKYTEDSE